jgi:hypothetical protein
MKKLKKAGAKPLSSRVKVFSSRIEKLPPDKKRLAIFIVAFAAIGTLLLIISFAATPTANLEPEDSTLTGCVTEITDAAASSGGAVQFGTGCSGAPTPPADITNGQGAWRMIGWGNSSISGADEATWQSRGFGGFKGSTNFLFGFGGGQQFRGSSVIGETAASWSQQKSLEQTDFGKIGGFEGYWGAKLRDTSLTGNQPVLNWWSDSSRALFAQRWGELAAFAKFQGLEGTSSDTEQGYWGLDYSGNTHTDAENAARIESWGYEMGKAAFTAYPDIKHLAYDWHIPEGTAGYDGIRPYWGPGTDFSNTNVWDGQEAVMPKNMLWQGYLKAMADFGGAGARIINAEADFYKPKTEPYYKAQTQASIAGLSQDFTQAQWNKIYDKIDLTHMTWAGTDWGLQAQKMGSVSSSDGTFTVTSHGYSNGWYVLVENGSAGGLDPLKDYVVKNATANTFQLEGASPTSSGTVYVRRISPHTSYQNTGEPAFANHLAMARKYGMGTRRVEYIYNGTPDNYIFYDTRHHGGIGPAPGGPGTLNNWYIFSGLNAPGGHLPGMLAAASQAPVSTTPPTITANAPVNNGNGTFTITGSAAHTDGIRGVNAFVYPNATSKVAAKLTWNKHGGSFSTNFNAATMDYTLTVTGSPGQYVMLTALSVHDQAHSIRVKL